MNERARWRHRRLVITGIVAIAAMVGGWWGYQHFVQWATTHYGIRTISMSYVDVYDQDLPEAIEQWLDTQKQSGVLQRVSRQEIADELLEAFPLVRKVSWGTYLPGHLHCMIVGVRPTFVINRSHVAGNNGTLYKRGDFRGYSEKMPALNINKDWLTKAVFEGVHRFFAELPTGLLRAYDMYYHDPYAIALVPVTKDLPHKCVCLVDEQSASRVRSLSELMELCADLKARMQPKEKEPICFFDFRFQDRIISRIIPRSEFVQLQRVDG